MDVMDWGLVLLPPLSSFTWVELAALAVPALLALRQGWRMLREGMKAQDSKIEIAVTARTLILSTALENANKALNAKDEYITELERQNEDARKKLERLAPDVLETAGRLDELERIVRASRKQT